MVVKSTLRAGLKKDRATADVELATPSKARLILAAEQLFAERGIDGVSLREVASAAGQANNAAVHYHFKSRQGLVAAIFAYRVAQMDRIRSEMLRRLVAAGQERDLRALLCVLLLPHVELVDEGGTHPHARFLGQYVTRYRPAGMPHVEADSSSAESLMKVTHLIYDRLGFLPRELARKRLELITLLFLNMLVRYDAGMIAESPQPPLQEQIDDTLEMALGALPAPQPAKLSGARGR